MEKARDISRGAEKRKAEIKSASDANTQSVLAENRRRVESNARRKAKLLEGNARREELDRVFDDARRNLIESDKDTYAKHISSMVKELPEGTLSGTFRIPAERAEETQSAIENAVKTSANFEESSEIDGGFLYIEDSAVYNLSFEKLIEDRKREKEVEVAKVLFL